MVVYAGFTVIVSLEDLANLCLRAQRPCGQKNFRKVDNAAESKNQTRNLNVET